MALDYQVYSTTLFEYIVFESVPFHENFLDCELPLLSDILFSYYIEI